LLHLLVNPATDGTLPILLKQDYWGNIYFLKTFSLLHLLVNPATGGTLPILLKQDYWGTFLKQFGSIPIYQKKSSGYIIQPRAVVNHFDEKNDEVCRNREK